MRALYTAAAVSNRALAWPSFTCTAIKSITHQVSKYPNLKRNQLGRYYQTAAVPYTLSDKAGQCMWADYLFGNCLDDGIGLIPPELRYLLSTLPKGSGRQHPGNTLSPPEADGDAADEPLALGSKHRHHSDEHGKALYSSLSKNVTMDSFLAAAGGVAAKAVVFLDFLPMLDMAPLNVSDARLHGPLRKCWALTLWGEFDKQNHA